MLNSRIKAVLIALATVITLGTAGYMAIESWSLFDALYMTIITIASVGFMEVHNLSTVGRAFTILLIICGSATLIYGLSVFTAFIVEGELRDVLRRRKMKRMTEKLVDHYIVCGMGRTGRYIVDELVKTGRDVIVIEKDPEKIKALTESDILNVEGDATQSAVLEAANIGRAAGLLSTLSTDADNLFAVVTAKGLRPDLKIIAKAVNEESERKLRQVGAESVVLPNFIGGLRMVSEMVRPKVVSFLDNMLREKDLTVRVEELVIPEGSRIVGQSLESSGVLDVEGVTVVAVSDGTGAYRFNPPRDSIVRKGEVIIVMGIVEMIMKLKAKVAA